MFPANEPLESGLHMGYLFFANALVVFHFGFVLFVLSGGLLVIWRKRFAFLHVPAVIWGVIVETTGWLCPLTPLENQWREAGGGVAYEGGFVEHYIMPVLYPHDITRDFQITLALLIAIINLIAYTVAFTRPRHTKKSAPQVLTSLRIVPRG